MKCNNCSTGFEGNYCPNCGQRLNSGRIVFKESLRDVLEHYFDFDAPLFRTILGLIISPGELIREYIFGKRKSYSHPFRYFILVLAVYLILKNLLDFDPITAFSEVVGAREMPNAQATKASNFFSNHINTFLIIYALTIALFSKLFNLNSKVYFIEYLALGFFTVAQYLFFSMIVLLLTMISPYFFLLNYLLALFYPSYVLTTFHSGNTILRITKVIFTAILAWFSYAFIGFWISFLIIAVFNL